MARIPKLIACILACELAGIIGSVFTISAIPAWYSALNKPFFSPPNWLFAPAWTLLYLLMGISLYLVWESYHGFKKAQVLRALKIFAVQLALNVLWSIAFFGLKSPLAGLIVIALLWLSILASILAFNKIDKRTALLLIPYILWVSFAALLNAAVFFLN